MRAQFQVAVGAGRAAVSLSFERWRAEQTVTRRWLVLLAAVLTVPFAAALAAAAVDSAIHAAPAHAAVAAGSPGWARLILLGPPLALILLALSRVRLHAQRDEGRWTGTVSAQLGWLELAVGLLALAVVVVFFGHLVADSWACANGVHSAC
ncbi:MAG: hypothetical protein JOZ46_11155 [Candidatus Dormibacteraeota bacterium]|nr:hypothetical protein [Candidatus Dormibacteraeota bacterium]MBV9526359.1 hypothetical protein [Candidatus Dormibacteraeota bacterium]